MVVPGMPTHVQGATGCGNLEILRYAHENGCPWDAQTCSHAADGGHLQVLQYAHDYGCPWGAETCKRAAAKGHLQVLQYAHYNVVRGMQRRLRVLQPNDIYKFYRTLVRMVVLGIQGQ